MRFLGHENVNPSKQQNRSGLRLNLGTTVLTTNFLNLVKWFRF